MTSGAPHDDASGAPSIEAKRRFSAPRIVVAIAVVAALLGGVGLAYTFLSTDPAVGLETEARSGQVSLWVSNPAWLAHDHTLDTSAGATEARQSLDGSIGGSDEETPTDSAGDLTATDSPAFAMPASMMPGTPGEGFHRVQVNLDFRNRGTAHLVSPLDFHLRADDGTTFGPNRGGTFTPTEIGAQQVFSTLLSFDIPVSLTGADVVLVWTAGLDTIDFALEGGEGHDHE